MDNEGTDVDEDDFDLNPTYAKGPQKRQEQRNDTDVRKNARIRTPFGAGRDDDEELAQFTANKFVMSRDML